MLGHGILAGKKTYAVAALAILGLVAGYLTGDVGLSEASQGILTAVLGITIRSGITTEAKKLSED